jgi:Flp pilus assembly protein TadG
MKRLIAFATNARGTATIEFALAFLFIFATLIVALDFGANARERLKLGHAVEQGAVLAFNQQTGSDTSGINKFIVAAAATKNAPTVTITCNGTAACGTGQCSCIDGGGNLVIAAACNSPCAGSSAISGNYMTIRATATYTPTIVPDKWLNGSVMASTAVVRLQ